MEGLSFAISANDDDFVNKMNSIQSKLDEVAQTVESQGSAMDAMFGKIASTAAQFGVGFSAIGFVKQVASVRGEFQALESSFKTLLGSEEKATELMQQLTSTAAKTPFDLQGVARGAKQLLAYGMEADKVNDKIVQLGDIAAGMGLSIDYITQLYGTTVSKDHMDTMDLKQFKGQGIAIDEAIAEVMKVTKQDVPKLITAGKVTGDIVEKAITALAGGDGKFAGMMDNQSKTILGQISNIEDSISSMFNKIGQSSEGLISGALGVVGDIVENYEEVGKAIAEVAVAYGTYKAVIAGLQAYNGIKDKAEIAALREMQAELDATGDSQLDLAVKKGQLSAAEAKEITALRAEIQGRVESAQAAVDAATADEVAARKAAQSAQLRMEAAEQELKSAIAARDARQAQLAAAATAEEKEILTKQLATAEAEVNTKAMEKNNAVKQAGVARNNALAAAEAKTTAETRLHTISIKQQEAAQKASSRMTSMLTMAQQGLKKALDATGLSMLANPYVAMAAAVAALGYGIYKLATYESDFEKAHKKVAATFNEATGKAAAEMASLKTLTDQLKDAEGNTEQYAAVKAKIISQYGQYHQGLDEEIDRLKNADELYRMLTKDILNHYMEKAKAQVTEEANDEYAKAYGESIKEAKDALDELRKAEESEIRKKSLPEAERAEQLANVAKKYTDAYMTIRDAIQEGQLALDEQMNLVARKERADGTFETSSLSSDQGVQSVLSQLRKKQLSVDVDGGSSREYFTNSLQSVVNDMSRAQAVRDRMITEANELYATEERRQEQSVAGATAEDKTKGGKSLSEVIKEIEAQAKKVEQVRKDARNKVSKTDEDGNVVGVFTKEDIETEEKNLKELKDIYKAYTGQVYDDIIKNQQAIADAQKALSKTIADNAKEQAKQYQKFEMEAEQARIDAMSDGLAKREAARVVMRQKEQASLEEERERALKEVASRAKAEFDAEQDIKEKQAAAAGNKSFRRKTFDTDEYIASQMQVEGSDVQKVNAALDEKRSTLITNQYWQEQEARKKDLQDAEKYVEGYLAIMKDFEKQKEDIKARVSSGELSEEEGATLIQNEEAIRDQNLKDQGYSDMPQYIDGITDGLTDVLGKNIEELAALLEVVETELTAAQEAGDETSDKVIALQVKSKTLRKLMSSAKAQPSPSKQAIKAWQNLSAGIEDCIGQLGDMGDILGETGQKTVETALSVAQTSSAIANGIVSMVQIGAQTIEGVSTAAATAIKTVERASVILAIIGAALALAQKIVALFKKDDPMEAIRADVEKTNDKIDEMKRAMRLDEGLNDTIFDSNLWADAVKNGNMVRESFDGLEKTVDDFANTDMFGNSPFHIGLKKAMAKFGLTTSWGDMMGVKEADDVFTKIGKLVANFDVQVEHRTWFRDEKRSTLKDLGLDLWDEDGKIDMDALVEFKGSENYNKLGDEQRKFIDQSIKDWQDYQKALEQLDNNLSSFFGEMGNALGDSLVEAWRKGEDAGDEFRSSVGDMMTDFFKQILIESTFGEIFKEMQGGMHDIMTSDSSADDKAAKMADLIGGKMGDIEANMGVFTSGLDVWADRMAQYGIDVKDMLGQQEATYGGYETMSEETGTELSGRFSAMYIVQSEQLEHVKNILSTVSVSNELQQQSQSILSDIRTLNGQANMYLADILEGQRKAYSELLEKTANIEKYTKSLGI